MFPIYGSFLSFESHFIYIYIYIYIIGRYGVRYIHCKCFSVPIDKRSGQGIEDMAAYFKYYIDDLLSHPDVANHPAFPILASRAIEVQDFLGTPGITERQGTLPPAINSLLSGPGAVSFSVKEILWHLQLLCFTIKLN